MREVVFALSRVFDHPVTYRYQNHSDKKVKIIVQISMTYGYYFIKVVSDGNKFTNSERYKTKNGFVKIFHMFFLGKPDARVLYIEF